VVTVRSADAMAALRSGIFFIGTACMDSELPLWGLYVHLADTPSKPLSTLH